MNFVDLDTLENEELEARFSGSYTGKIIKSLGPDVFRCGMRIYRKLVFIEEMLRNTVGVSEKVLIGSGKQIRKIKGLITEPDASFEKAAMDFLGNNSADPEIVKRVAQALFDNTVKSEALRAAGELTPERAMQYAWQEKEKFSHRPYDIPLKFLIYFLASHLKAMTGVKNFYLINKFLQEHRIPCGRERKDVKDHFERTEKDKLQAMYSLFRHVYLAYRLRLNYANLDLDRIIETTEMSARLAINPSSSSPPLAFLEEFPSLEEILP